jgi:hypothetical protein
LRNAIVALLPWFAGPVIDVTSELKRPMRQRVWAVCAGVLALAVCASASAQVRLADPELVYRPELSIGDWWEFRNVSSRTWRLTVVAKRADGYTLARSSAGQHIDNGIGRATFLADLDGWITTNIDAAGKATPTGDKWEYVKFPLKVGSRWFFDATSTTVRSRTEVQTWHLDSRAEAWETIDLGGRSVRAIKIEIAMRQQGGGMGYSTNTLAVWYAPEAKRIVRLVASYAGGPSANMIAFGIANLDPPSIVVTRPSAPPATILPPEVSPDRPPIAPSTPQPAKTEPRTASATVASQQPVDLRRVSAPVWRPGYEWEYRWESPQGKGTYVWSFAREETVDGTAFYVVSSGTREIYWRKHDVAYYMDRVPGGVETRFSPIPGVPWPLSSGHTWKWAFTRERPIARQTTEENLNCVVSEELVTVPAGTFNTLKIACRDERTGQVAENWYSPLVKQLVKETRVFDYGTRVRELIRYRVE